jgi:hypothetical protein
VDRFDRQVRLAEVGPEGQARIESARVSVGLDGFAAEVAARYLAGAGVSNLCVRDAAASHAAHAIHPGVEVTVDAVLPRDSRALSFDLRDPACREICRGAHAALRALRAALSGDKHN